MVPIVGWITLCPRPSTKDGLALAGRLFRDRAELGCVIFASTVPARILMRDVIASSLEQAGLKPEPPDFSPVVDIPDLGMDVLVVADAELLARVRRGKLWRDRLHASILLLQNPNIDPVLDLLGVRACQRDADMFLYDYIGLADAGDWVNAADDILAAMAHAAGRAELTCTDAMRWVRRPIAQGGADSAVH
jgi:hypothetical protein